jgi:hypothetical protein
MQQHRSTTAGVTVLALRLLHPIIRHCWFVLVLRVCAKALNRFAIVAAVGRLECCSQGRVRWRRSRCRVLWICRWGTSSPEDKLAGDLGNVIEATSIGGRRSDFFTAEKLASGNLGLLQQYRHSADEPGCPHSRRVLEGKRTTRKPTSQEEASRCGSAVDLPSSRRGRNYLLVN